MIEEVRSWFTDNIMQIILGSVNSNCAEFTVFQKNIETFVPLETFTLFLEELI